MSTSEERRLIFDVKPDLPCGCRWQLWAEGDVWHIGAACRRCQLELVALVREHYPNVAVREGD